MNHAEPAVIDPAADLKNKTLLVISSPNPKKKFIYQRLKELGFSKMILMSSEANWVSKITDGFVECDPLDEVACMAKIEELVKTEDRRRYHLLGKRGAAVRDPRAALRLDRPHAAGRPQRAQ